MIEGILQNLVEAADSVPRTKRYACDIVRHGEIKKYFTDA
jgi:hypothetical protein